MVNRRKLDKVMADIQKSFAPENGKAIVQWGPDLPPIEPIPASSPMLSHTLGIGGWPRGKLIEVFGREGAGKTTMGIQALQDCYDYEDGKRAMCVVDIEHRFDKDWGETLGMNLDDTIFLEPMDAEDATDQMVRLMKSGEICAVLFDSVGASQDRVGHSEFTEREGIFGGSAKVMSRNVRTIAPVASIYDTTVLYLNQTRDDLSGNHQIITPGGRALKHGCSIRLYLRSGKDKFREKRAGYKDPVEVGFRMFFKTQKNSFAPPFREGQSDFFFEPSMYLDHVGFDTDGDIESLGISMGIITKAGGWYSWEGIKANGRERFFQALDVAQHESLMDQIREHIAEAPGKVGREGEMEAVGPELPDEEDE